MEVIATHDGKTLATALFGGRASASYGLTMAREGKRRAEWRLAQRDEAVAAGPTEHIASDRIMLDIWQRAHSSTARTRIVQSIERYEIEIIRCQERLRLLNARLT